MQLDCKDKIDAAMAMVAELSNKVAKGAPGGHPDVNAEAATIARLEKDNICLRRDALFHQAECRRLREESQTAKHIFGSPDLR